MACVELMRLAQKRDGPIHGAGVQLLQSLQAKLIGAGRIDACHRGRRLRLRGTRRGRHRHRPGAVAFGWLLGGETFPRWSLVGGALVLAGVWMIFRKVPLARIRGECETALSQG